MTKYAEIVATLREEIVRGRFSPNDQLPSEAALGARFGASRGTVRKAIGLLHDEHLVHARRGAGTFVRSVSPVGSFFTLSTFEADMRSRGLVPSTRLLKAETAPASSDEGERLRLPEGTPLVHIAALRLADDMPRAWEYRVFGAELCPGILSEDLEHQSMYWLLTQKYSIPITRIEHVVEIRPVDALEADLLETDPGVTAYAIDRLTFTATDRPAVWFRALHLDPEGTRP